MNIVTVCASKEYEVRIESGILSDAASHIRDILSGGKIAIISDSNVWPLYGEALKDNLQAGGYAVIHYVIPAGESSKNGQQYLQLLEFLAQNELTRSDGVIALGGGVVGDLTGFVAATYLRGIVYIQIPTSLLAMVDSSVGGKTAIDLTAGKNLAGAFYQPSLVLCDPETLNTLPADVFADGCAEVIKYGILYDAQLFDHLMKYGKAFDRMAVITKCVSLKRDVVCCDEFDTGLRMKLNLGHTLGHAIEGCSQFKISHGKAVAIGMALVTKAAAANHICKESLYHQIVGILKVFDLPFTTDFSSHELFELALSDKKRAGSSVNLIVPHQIGNCQITSFPIAQLQEFIKSGL